MHAINPARLIVYVTNRNVEIAISVMTYQVFELRRFFHNGKCRELVLETDYDRWNQHKRH